MFCYADDILLVGYDSNGTDHDRMLCMVIQNAERRI